MHKSILALAVFTVIFTNYCESNTVRTAISYEPAVKDAIRNAMTECSKKETDIPELIQRLKDGTWNEDKDFKEFVYCVFVRSDYINEDTGRVKIDKAVVSFPDPELMKKIMTDCDKGSILDPVNPVETIFLHFKCYQTNSPYSVNID